MNFRSSVIFNKELESRGLVTFASSYAILQAVLKNEYHPYIEGEQELDLRGLILVSYFRWETYNHFVTTTEVKPLSFFLTADEEAQEFFNSLIQGWIEKWGNTCHPYLLSELRSYKLNDENVQGSYNLANYTEILEYYIYSVIGGNILYKHAKKEDEIVDCKVQIISRVVELTKRYGQPQTNVGVLHPFTGESSYVAKAYRYLQVHRYMEVSPDGMMLTNKSIV